MTTPTIKQAALDQIAAWTPPGPDQPGCRIRIDATPPSEPAWWTATCTCGLAATSASSPILARQLVTVAHVRREVAA